ncbi:MAG TPA: hypothetical protein VFJ16_06035 [Longimicrobium sp.]|nr:hypothetical protein [Longimicrobium sp.]
MAMLRMNALELRELADAAAGSRGPRGEPFYLLGGPNPRIVRGVVGQPPPPDAVVEVDTIDVTPDRPLVTSLQLSASDRTLPLELAEKYDSVFWSESAVEKFVIPYYASKVLWEAGKVLNKLTYNWYLFPEDDIPADPTGQDPAVPADSIPFAIAHTPDSDYFFLGANDARRDSGTANGNGDGTDDASSGSRVAERTLHLIFRDSQGNVYARRLDRLPDPPPGWERPAR